MKKTLTILLIGITAQVFAQNNPVTGITISLPANPDANTKAFTIRGNEQQSRVQSNTPVNNTVFKGGDIAKPVTFRWTPLIPKPQEPVTYRLRVWQLMQGQTGTQARTTNQPIVTKDVDNLDQSLVIITGPCKPPYLCDFVWDVQALNRDGKPIGGNGTSELFAFKYDLKPVATGTPVKATERKQ